MRTATKSLVRSRRIWSCVIAASLAGAAVLWLPRETPSRAQTPAAGMPDGAYELGGQSVVVAGRVVRLATADGSPGAIAGSTLTMDAALRRVWGETGPPPPCVRAQALRACFGLGRRARFRC